MFQGSFKGVSRKFQKCFKEVSRVFQGSVKSASKKFQGSFKSVLESFKGVSTKIEGRSMLLLLLSQAKVKTTPLKFSLNFLETVLKVP